MSFRKDFLMRRLIVLFGSFFYCGFFPIAPATFASFIWVVAFLFIPHFVWLANPFSLLVTIPLAVYTSHKMETMYGRDASEIVIDEFAGMQVSLLLVKPEPLVAIIAFFLFRFFDIFKPFPINRSQRIPGGFGVVLDDILAGIYARIALGLIFIFLKGGFR